MTETYSNGRDYISSIKLNYFHYTFKQLTGYTIHPIIDLSSRPCRIADLGTQTAIWPITVADDFTSGEVHGFDISEKFFPPSTWLPSNVELHVHDIYEPFPESFVGQFDVVHLRLFLSLSATKVSSIICNIFTLLKPGGHVQWVEHDKTEIITTEAFPNLSNKATKKFEELMKMPFPNYDSLWTNTIGSTMIKNGFEVVVEERIKVRPSILPQINDLHLISIDDVPRGLSPAVDEYREKYFETLKDEYRKGVATMDGFVCVVGRKPL